MGSTLDLQTDDCYTCSTSTLDIYVTQTILKHPKGAELWQTILTGTEGVDAGNTELYGNILNYIKGHHLVPHEQWIWIDDLRIYTASDE